MVPVAYGKSKVKTKVKPATPVYEVVEAHLRTLTAIHNIQISSLAELEADKAAEANPMFGAIRSFTKYKLELAAGIASLKDKHFDKPYETIIPHILTCYKEEYAVYGGMLDISKTFASPVPKKGVDYDALAARMPELRAKLEYLDETLFQGSKLLSLALIDTKKVDSKGNVSHLVITKRQREQLIERIDGTFREDMKKDQKNWTTLSAEIIKVVLDAHYLSSDEAVEENIGGVMEK
jgi:hypothetical protein